MQSRWWSNYLGTIVGQLIRVWVRKCVLCFQSAFWLWRMGLFWWNSLYVFNFFCVSLISISSPPPSQLELYHDEGLSSLSYDLYLLSVWLILSIPGGNNYFLYECTLDYLDHNLEKTLFYYRFRICTRLKKLKKTFKAPIFST